MRSGLEIDGDVLRLDGPMAQTRMACPDDLAAQDAWLAEFLSGGPTVSLDGDALTLRSADATITATELA